MSERFVYHKGGKIARKDLSSGSLYFDGNAFSSVNFPSTNGNYVLRINEGKPEYVAEESAPQLDNNVYPSNFQNDETQILTREGMIPVMKDSDSWTSLQLTTDNVSVITYTNGTWTTRAISPGDIGITINDSDGYVLSNSAAGITTKKVDSEYIMRTLGANTGQGLMTYSNRSYVNIDFPVNGLYGIKKSNTGLSSEAIDITTFFGDNQDASGVYGSLNGTPVKIVADDIVTNQYETYGVVYNSEGNLVMRRNIQSNSYSRLSTNTTIDENISIPLYELFNGFHMNTNYAHAFVTFTLVLHISDTAAFDDLNTDAYLAISDGKYTQDVYYFKNPMSNTLTIKFSYIVPTGYDISLKSANIPRSIVSIAGGIGNLHVIYF